MKTRFLIKNSLDKKVKSKWFKIVNIILCIFIVGIINIDSIITFFGGDFNEKTKIEVVDNTGYSYDILKSSIENTIESLNISTNNSYEYEIQKSDKSVDELKKDINKNIIIEVNNDDDNYISYRLISKSYINSTDYQLITTSLNSSKVAIALSKSNIDVNELNNIYKEANIKREYIDENKKSEEESTSMIMTSVFPVFILPFFMLTIFIVQMIGAEINEEKSTRGMEIIIGNVSAKAHFFSKVLASNIFVLLQGALIIIYGLIGFVVRKLTTKSGSLSMVKGALDSASASNLLETFKTSNLLDKIGYIIPLIILLIVLSFLAYSLLAGILASVTTNMENFQQLQTPLMIINVVGYYLIIMSSAFPGSIFIKIMSIIPLISVTVAPSMLISGEIGIGIIIIAILLLVLLDYLLIKYGLRVYKAGILNYSENDLFKKMLKAVKEK